MEALNKLAGRPFGLSLAALKKHGKSHPALCALIERAPAILEQRRAIVRQTQIANLYPKPKSLKRN